MTDYNYAKINMNEEIKNPDEFNYKFAMMCHALGVKNTDNDGKFKDMETYFEHIAISYMEYQRKVNGMNFFRKK